MESANSRQIAGTHYQKVEGEQHWDRMWRLFGPGYFVGSVTAYVERHLDKAGIEDLLKARHYIDKLVELERAAAAGTGPQPGRTPPMLGDRKFGPSGCAPPAPAADPNRSPAIEPAPDEKRCVIQYRGTGFQCVLEGYHDGPCLYDADHPGRLHEIHGPRPSDPPCDHDYDRWRSLKDGREYLWCVRCGDRKGAGGSFPYAGQCVVETCPVE